MDENGVLYTMDQRSRLVSLWRWEADRLRKRAERMGIHLTIRPGSFIVDKMNSKAVILLWYLDYETCPFLVDDRCSVWADRPFTCRTFPMYGHRTGVGLSSLCPDLIRPPMGDDEVDNGKLLVETYPDEVVYLFKDLQVYKAIFNFIRRLEENKVIQWDKEADPVHAEKLIASPESRIDLFDLVIDTGIIPRSKMDDIFKELDSVDEVRGKVDLRITRDMIGI